MKKKRSTRRRERKLQEIRNLPEGVAYRMSGIEMAKKLTSPQGISFKMGVYKTEKDKPRDNNWRMWDME